MIVFAWAWPTGRLEMGGFWYLKKESFNPIIINENCFGVLSLYLYFNRIFVLLKDI